MSETMFAEILIGLCVVLFVAWRCTEHYLAKMNDGHQDDNGSDPGPLPSHLAAHARGKGPLHGAAPELSETERAQIGALSREYRDAWAETWK